MKRMTADRAEIGLQVIANTLVGVDLVEQRKSGRRRLLGRRRGDDDQRPHVPRAVPRAAQARRRDRRAVADRSGRRIPAGQAPEAHDVEGDQPDPLRPPARAAARLGVGDRRAGSTRRVPMPVGQRDPAATRFPRPPRTSRSVGAMPADRYAEIHAGHRWDVPARIQHRARLLRPLGRRPHALRAVLGRRIGRDVARIRSGTCSARPTGCPTCSPASASRAATRSRSSCRSGRETAVAHLAVYQMGAVAVPLSFLFGPDALEYRLENSAGEGRARRSAIAAQPRADPRPACRA